MQRAGLGGLLKGNGGNGGNGGGSNGTGRAGGSGHGQPGSGQPTGSQPGSGPSGNGQPGNGQPGGQPAGGGFAARGTGGGRETQLAGGSNVGTGNGNGNGSGGDGDEFELSDIVSKDNFDRIENFEGSRRPNRPQSAGGNTGGNTGGKPGAPKGPGKGAGSPAGGSEGGGIDPSSELGQAIASRGQQTGTRGSNSKYNGIESLDDSDNGEQSESEGSATEGSDESRAFNLGSSNPSIPVEDHRNKKKKISEREMPHEPEMLASRHWGISEPGAAIGLERDLRIDVEPKRYVIGRKHAVNIDAADSREDSFVKIVTVLDLQARDWGKPPEGFYWKPSLRYVIADGGEVNYERVHALLERAGLTSSREYADKRHVEPDPPKPVPTKPIPEPAAPKPSRRFFRGLR
jgi:hypothetical protein